MTDKKLTDNEIIEDLKLWIDLSKRTDTPPFITYLFLQQILDLINRLQEENENLRTGKKPTGAGLSVSNLLDTINNLTLERSNLIAENERLKTNINWLKGLLNYDFAVIRTRSGKGEKLKQIIHYRVKEIKAEAYKEVFDKMMLLSHEVVSKVLSFDLDEFYELKKELVGEDK